MGCLGVATYQVYRIFIKKNFGIMKCFAAGDFTVRDVQH